MGCGTGKIRILAISGSLRAASGNTGLIRFLQSLSTSEYEVQIYPIGDLPMLNPDLTSNFPASVKNIRDKVRSVDAVIFASPEYNSGVSGVLKNAFDWVSIDKTRYGGENSPLTGKKIAVLTSSYLSKKPYDDIEAMAIDPKPILHKEHFWVQMTRENKIFDEKGNLISQKQQQNLKQWFVNFIKFVNSPA